MDTLKEIFAFPYSLLAPVTACIVTYIAIQQHKTDKQKLRLSLFDKRYAFYEYLDNFIHRTLGASKASDDKLFELRDKVRDVIFLFGEDVDIFCKKVKELSFDLSAVSEELKGPVDRAERLALVKKRRKIFDELSTLRDSMPIFFRDYLKIQQ